MNTITIEGVNINVDQVAKEHEGLDTLKAMELFPEGPKQAASYEALWEKVQEVKALPVEVKVEVKKPVKKSKKAE